MILDSYLQISQGKSPSSRTIVDRYPWCPRADTQWRTRSRRRSACPQTAAVRRRARQPHRCGRTAGVRSRGGMTARGRRAAAAVRGCRAQRRPTRQRPDALAQDEPTALRQPGRAGGRPHFGVPAAWRVVRLPVVRSPIFKQCAPSGVTPWLCSPRERAAEAAGSSPKNRPRCVLQDWLCVCVHLRAHAAAAVLSHGAQKINRFWYVANKLLAVLCT